MSVDTGRMRRKSANGVKQISCTAPLLASTCDFHNIIYVNFSVNPKFLQCYF